MSTLFALFYTLFRTLMHKEIFICTSYFFTLTSDCILHRFHILLYIRNTVFLHDAAHSFTMAEPTIAPSDWSAIFFACSGVEIPKPTAQGISFAAFTSFTIAPISVVIWLLVPVTPREDTQYTKPSASFAIMADPLVGGRCDQGDQIQYHTALHTLSNSSFSSNGTSGRISPSIPTSDAFLIKRSVP